MINLLKILTIYMGTGIFVYLNVESMVKNKYEFSDNQREFLLFMGFLFKPSMILCDRFRKWQSTRAMKKLIKTLRKSIKNLEKLKLKAKDEKDIEIINKAIEKRQLLLLKIAFSGEEGEDYE